MLQVLLRITEAVMKRPQENQRKDSFAESLAAILFRVSLHLVAYTLLLHRILSSSERLRSDCVIRTIKTNSMEQLPN